MKQMKYELFKTIKVKIKVIKSRHINQILR